MYLPAHFEERDVEALYGFIETHPLGSLVVNSKDGLDANHIPFLLDRAPGEGARLLAHIARANPLWTDAPASQDVLVIFRTQGAYVSPNWYPSKHESHRQVPTWNYQAVHVRGKLIFHDDERFCRGLVARLTRIHEQRVGSEPAWKMTDSAPEYIDKMLAAIVGVEIQIEALVGKWKLSQNKDARDMEGAARALQERGEIAISQAMLSAKS